MIKEKPQHEARPRGGKPIIGLLGGIGAGKSLVARQLASLGCAVIDADALAKQALDEPTIITRLRAWWGDGILTGDGRIDRAAVAKRVFDDESRLRRLEGLIHPRVHARRGELRAAYRADDAVRAIVEDVPLLLETGLEGQCDALVFVDAAPAVRARRVKQTRGWSGDELARRQNRQASLDKKAEAADYVIDNNGDEAATLDQVRRVLSQILNPQ